MLVVEVRGGAEGEEELAAVRAGAGVGHRENAGTVMAQRGMKFVAELVARSAGAGAGRVAALGHEAGDDAVEGRAVVKAGPRQVDEVLDGERHPISVQLNRDVAAFGLESGGVALRGIERAGRRRVLVGHRFSLGVNA